MWMYRVSYARRMVYFYRMRNVLILFLLVMSVANATAQEVQVENLSKKYFEHVQDNIKSSSNDLLHRYMCRRCGSENQMDWTLPKDKKLELIPHCGFCGKKYWPKFKPTGFLERTYSRLDFELTKAN